MESSSSSQGTPSSPHQSLLSKLTPKYDGNQTCHQCLRSKVTPSAVVVDVLDDNPTQWSAQVLLQAHQMLLENYVPLVKNNVPTSMQAFEKWGTTFYFLQFLLAQTTESLPPNQVLQIATRLIQSMASELANVPVPQQSQSQSQSQPQPQPQSSQCSNEESNDDEQDDEVLHKDATKSLDRRLVACYCFQSLVRLNQFAQSQIGLVAPLWKGICNVHRTCPIPASLLEQAIQHALKMLKEGCPRLMNSLIIVASSNNANDNANDNNNVVASFIMQGKLISFLALRLANLMGTCHGSKKTRSKAYKHLLSLQGMNLAMEGQGVLPPPIQKTCTEVATKTGKALLEMVVDNNNHNSNNSHHSNNSHNNNNNNHNNSNNNHDIIHRPALDALIPIATSKPKDGKDAKVELLAFKSIHIAKVQLAVAILDKFCTTIYHECLLENMDALLVLCESLYAIFLPQSYGPLVQSLWWKECAMAQKAVGLCLKPMASILVRIDHALSQSPSSTLNQTQIHRLLIRWLAPYRSTELHPLSREVILTVMHLFLMASPSGPLSLMVKLLLDPRTETSMRQNLSSLLVMILASSNKSNAPLKDLVLRRIETEVQGIIPKRSKKRPLNQKEKLPCKHYSFVDLNAITSVLVHLSVSSQSLMEAMQQLVRQLQRAKENAKSTPRISNIEWNCMVLALMRGSLLGDPCDFHSKMGTSLLEFQKQIIGAAVSPTQSKPLRQSNERTMVRHCMLCSAVLRFSTHACNGLHQNRDGATRLVPIQDLCRLLKHCATGKDFLPTSSSNKNLSQQYRSLVLFDAIRLLEAIGFAIPQGCPTVVLDTVKDVFVRLLSLNDWAIVSQAIGSLVCFGQRLDKSYQRVLPSCLPAEKQPLFRRRMLSNRGQVHSRQYGDSDLVSLNIGQTLLSSHCEKREIGKSIFPATSTMDIAPGSYFLKMSTQEGRHAWVIFEPGPESIQDIKYMNGMDDDADVPEDIQKLKRAVIVEKGGLKCLLQSLQLRS
ncbi:MAG: hypothetical protein SGBAC_003913 [Bacillariaceae sp.]